MISLIVGALYTNEIIDSNRYNNDNTGRDLPWYGGKNTGPGGTGELNLNPASHIP